MTNCSLHESEFRLCPEVVLDWFLGLPIRGVLGLPILGYGCWLCAIPLIMARKVYPGLSVLVPIGLHDSYSPAALYS